MTDPQNIAAAQAAAETARSLLESGELTAALPALEQAATLAAALPDPPGEAQLRLLLGQARARAGELEAALLATERAAALAEEHLTVAQQLAALLQRGQLLAALPARQDEALAQLEEVRQSAGLAGLTALAGVAGLEQLALLEELGPVALTIAVARELLAFAQREGQADLAAAAAQRLGDALDGLGRRTEAAAALERGLLELQRAGLLQAGARPATDSPLDPVVLGRTLLLRLAWFDLAAGAPAQARERLTQLRGLLGDGATAAPDELGMVALLEALAAPAGPGGMTPGERQAAIAAAIARIDAAPDSRLGATARIVAAQLGFE